MITKLKMDNYKLKKKLRLEGMSAEQRNLHEVDSHTILQYDDEDGLKVHLYFNRGNDFSFNVSEENLEHQKEHLPLKLKSGREFIAGFKIPNWIEGGIDAMRGDLGHLKEEKLPAIILEGKVEAYLDSFKQLEMGDDYEA